MPTRNVLLTDHIDNFIEAGSNSGRFNNGSEIILKGLRLLEEREKEEQAITRMAPKRSQGRL